MYTKQETSKQRQAFWTAFGQYMQPVLSAEGIAANWVNYKTGISGIHFKMDTDTKLAQIGIVLSHKDLDIQRAHYDTFCSLSNLLHHELGETWHWQALVQDEYGKTVSKIGTELSGVNINQNGDWPVLISFFKSRIIALDAFWSQVKPGFE